MNKSNEYFSTSADCIGETPNAYRIMNSLNLEVWIPKSQLRNAQLNNGILNFDIPNWLAEDKNVC